MKALVFCLLLATSAFAMAQDWKCVKIGVCNGSILKSNEIESMFWSGFAPLERGEKWRCILGEKCRNFGTVLRYFGPLNNILFCRKSKILDI